MTTDPRGVGPYVRLMQIFAALIPLVLALAGAAWGLLKRHRRVHVKVDRAVAHQLLIVETVSRRPDVKFRPVAVEVETGGRRYPVQVEHFRFVPSRLRYGAWEVPEGWVQEAVIH